MIQLGPLARHREYMAHPPARSDPFASSFAAVEQFNPQRYYAEAGVPASALPTGTTGEQTGGAMNPSSVPAPVPVWVVIVALVFLVWALERHKVRIFGQFRTGAGS